MKQSTLAGIGSLIALTGAIASAYFIDNSVTYITLPSFLILAFIGIWFWYKGNYGATEDKSWVEKNF